MVYITNVYTKSQERSKWFGNDNDGEVEGD